MNDAERQQKLKNVWVYAGLISFLSGLVFFVILGKINSDIYETSITFRNDRTWMPVVMALAVVSLISSIVATVKIRGYKKIFTILLALVSIPLFLVAHFSWWISQ